MLTQEQLDELETKHGRIAHIRGKTPAPTAKNPSPQCPWEVVFRKPKGTDYKYFRKLAHNPATVSDAQEWLARATVVYPSREAFDALLEDYPGIPEIAAKPLGELAGFAVEEAEKA